MPVLSDQGIGSRQDLRGGAVILQHHHRPGPRKCGVQIQEIADVSASPGIDRLGRVAYDKKIFMIAAQNFHQLILQPVDILEFIDHDVFQALLPFQADLFVLSENIQGKFDQVIVVKGKVFLLLVQISVENDLVRGICAVVLLPEDLQGHIQHVQIVFGLAEQFLDLDHIPGVGKRPVPER